MKSMYIGEASEKSGATVKAIRLYEKLGLLTNISRSNNYRVFSEENVMLIKFIKIAQSFDFTLDEIKAIIYSNNDLVDWQAIRQAITLKNQKITSEITRLQAQQIALHQYDSEIEQCLIEHNHCSFPSIEN